MKKRCVWTGAPLLQKIGIFSTAQGQSAEIRRALALRSKSASCTGSDTLQHMESDGMAGSQEFSIGCRDFQRPYGRRNRGRQRQTNEGASGRELHQTSLISDLLPKADLQCLECRSTSTSMPYARNRPMFAHINQPPSPTSPYRTSTLP